MSNEGMSQEEGVDMLNVYLTSLRAAIVGAGRRSLDDEVQIKKLINGIETRAQKAPASLENLKEALTMFENEVSNYRAALELLREQVEPLCKQVEPLCKQVEFTAGTTGDASSIEVPQRQQSLFDGLCLDLEQQEEY